MLHMVTRPQGVLALGAAILGVIAVAVAWVSPRQSPATGKPVEARMKPSAPARAQPQIQLQPAPHPRKRRSVKRRKARPQAEPLQTNSGEPQTFALADRLSSPTEAATTLSPATPAKSCFDIQRIDLEVPDSLPAAQRAAGASEHMQDNFHFLREELDRQAGRCIGRPELEALLKTLTGRILDKGYTTTRLGIPEQNLSSGILHITLVPGMIHAIRFEPADAGGSWKTAFPARPGDLLNLRDLEQGLEQMKRVPSQDVDMQLVPAQQVGESDIVVNVRRGRTWKWTATLDDSGSNGTGKYQSSVNLALDNPFGINDLFNMGVNNDAGNNGGNRGTRGNNAYYSMPFGNTTVTLAGSTYQYHQRIVGTYQTFVSSGTSENLELKLAWVLGRSQAGKTSLQLRTAKRWSHAFIDDTEIAVQQRNNTLAEIGLTHKHNIGAAQFETSLAQRSGVHWFGAQQDLPNRLSTDPTFFYELTTLDMSLSIPFKLGERPWKYNGALRAQTTQSSVYATEYINIGNRWTVRGFDGESGLAAERGWYLRNEFETPLGQSPHSIYLALDMGMVYGTNVPNLVGDHLAGAALGLRGGLFKGMYYDVFSGWPLYKPANFPNAEPAAGFSLTYQF